MATLSRRRFLRAAGTGAVVPALFQATPADAGAPQTPPLEIGHDPGRFSTTPSGLPETFLFFNGDEQAFVVPAVERLIPSDDTGPGAREAGVAYYLDKQLGGAWGAGERLYRSGPWQPGTPTQGYQLPFTPAEFFRTALRAIHGVLQQRQQRYAELNAQQQDDFLKELQDGKLDLDGIPSKVFFDQFWEMVTEGYFCDPVYGGNRNMVSWRMIGFPGAYANYYDLIDHHGISYQREPMSLAQANDGHIHVDPNIPARLRNGGI